MIIDRTRNATMCGILNAKLTLDLTHEEDEVEYQATSNQIPIENVSIFGATDDIGVVITQPAVDLWHRWKEETKQRARAP